MYVRNLLRLRPKLLYLNHSMTQLALAERFRNTYTKRFEAIMEQLGNIQSRKEHDTHKVRAFTFWRYGAFP